MIFMTFLQAELKDVDPSEWNKKYLSYDNMCVRIISLFKFNFLVVGVMWIGSNL